jgi:translation initiation factor IF-3
VLDYSKYKYEQEQKQKQAASTSRTSPSARSSSARRSPSTTTTTKKGHVERFLRDQSKVKVTIMFRGREMTHPERGRMILDRLAEELEGLAIVEQRPIQDGRNMTMIARPVKAAAEKPARRRRSRGEAENRGEAAAEKPEPEKAPAEKAPTGF